MLKPSITNISESNIALFGTELEFNIKKASAEGEPEFKQFAQPKSGTYLWRVRNFKLEPCGSDDVADFFRGDSYLALCITGSGAGKTYDIFYWIGSETSLDEAGTAAYKAFELDNVLGRKAIQHREVCGYETDEFMRVFPSARFLDGGYDSGFHHVIPDAPPRKRLLRVYTDRLSEVPTSWSSLRSNGIFILISGMTVYQWTGDKASTRLKAPAMQAVRFLDDSHDSRLTVIALTQDENNKDFAAALGSTGDEPVVEEVSAAGELTLETRFDVDTGRRTRSAGMIRITKYDGKFSYVDVRTNDDAIYIEDNGSKCLVYGKLPLAALCAIAYFNWSKTSPRPTEFAH